MKTLKVLAIGNSFSQDAMRYLSQIAKANGYDIKCVNLFIGGCSLKKHYFNILDDTADYIYEYRGDYTGLSVSIKQVLKSDDWDIITLQQASHFSFDFDTYTPYITAVSEYVKKYAPKAKIYLHKTWAYEDGSQRLFDMGYQKALDMYNDIEDAYTRASKLIKADGVIPDAKAMFELSKKMKAHRDTFHASLGAGRYALGLVWYMTLTGNEVKKHITEFDVKMNDDEINAAIEAAKAAVGD